MLPTTRRSQLPFIIVITIGLLLSSLPAAAVSSSAQTSSQSSIDAVLKLIDRQSYDEAIARLEEILERDPRNAEALTYMATANLYQRRDFSKALEDFKEAFKAGGGASFVVTHSHEKFTTADVVDYCRGWLHLRKDGIEFVPAEGTHGFKCRFNDVEEFQTNKLSKKVFHIKCGGKTQNFRGRSNTDLEPLLIVALYKSFTQN
jgi:tetratricopeptide (TPR) repeat protein